MKKALFQISILISAFALLFAVVLCSAPSSIAHADNSATVVKATVSNLEGNEHAGKSTLKLFYEDTTFFVPESYFVKIESKTGSVGYNVRYCGEQFFLQKEPDVDIQTETIVVGETETISPDVRLSLKNGESAAIGNVTITTEHTIKLLGFGETDGYIFVSAILNGNRTYGLIEASKVENFVVPYQSRTQRERDALFQSNPSTVISDGTITPKTSLAIRIALIIGIAVPALLIAILLFKPSKNSQRRTSNAVRREGDDVDYDEPQRRRDGRRYDDRDGNRDRDYDDRRDDGRYDDRRGNRDDRDDRRYDRGYDDRDGRR